MVNDPARSDEKGGMGTFVAPGEHPGMAAGLRRVSDAAAFGTIRQEEPAPRETDERTRLRKAVAVALLPSMALWTIIWYALSHLISNWP
jgi:hypothetical protein